jgi:methylenetetrahydrofolate dehydrogenase (NADP+)/methenyltetrahydrofolate cyclohydrolase
MTTSSTPAQILDGTAAARQIRAEVAAGAAALAAETGVVPGLAVVLVGEHPASGVYVRNKDKAAQEAGIRSQVVRLPAASTEAEILAAVGRLNRDAAVHGVLVQLPLPAGVDEHRVLLAVDPDKDVDGFHPLNAGRMLIGLAGFLPCTPAGVIELLRRNRIPLSGKHAVVVGRSNIVGKPMAVLLLRENCTVTIAHSRTADLPAVTARADVLVVAIGRAGFVGGEHVKPGAVVVDVGIHTLTDEGECRRVFGDDEKRLAQLRAKGATLCGDVRPAEVAAKAGWLSPVPGGVGPLTIAMLLANTLEAARRATRRG